MSLSEDLKLDSFGSFESGSWKTRREGEEEVRISDKECGPTIQIDKMYASTCFFFSLFFIVSKLLYLFLPSLFYVLDSTWWKGDTFITRVSNSIGRGLLRIIFRG